MNAHCDNKKCVDNGEYTHAFTQGQSSPVLCDAWNTFRANLNGPYTSIVLRGSNDPTGVECTGPDADTLCKALKDNKAVTIEHCGGGDRNWVTSLCLGQIALSALINNEGLYACSCAPHGYTARPCSGKDWGGINGSCGGASQTITVICK
jgi:hypothetical protein